MQIITAKFPATCAFSGQQIKKGQQCVYDASTKKTYTLSAYEQQKEFLNNKKKYLR